MSMSLLRQVSMALMGAALMVGPSLAEAQTPGPRPVLGGHRLIWNPMTETAIPQTHVRNLTGAGSISGVEFVPAFDLGGGITVPAVKGDLLFTELEFEYMHAVQPWLGVWAKFGGLGRVGTSAGSILSQGISAIFGYELGWLLRLYQNETFVLSGTVALSNDDVTDVDILRWVRGVIDDTGDPLVRSGPRLRTKGGLRGAWGLNESWGVQFKTEVGYGEPTTRSGDNEWLWDSAASLSYDLNPRTSVPIGFALSAASRAAPREGANPEVRARDLGLRTAFTGRDNFLIALDTNWNAFQLPGGDDAQLLRAGLSLQLFF